ncbi:hypothetical protein QNO09_15390 [Streptomyces sp. 378]|uniref:hypothetical protein n=1 Tax=Streptomyces sp. 378 TaxID=3049412 RepID=UPI0024C230AE|nr:hypothetical protein [Streptomyces sp. 378]MDK1344670.1 hypothetical protein [Streptomyces sp. 378]
MTAHDDDHAPAYELTGTPGSAEEPTEVLPTGPPTQTLPTTEEPTYVLPTTGRPTQTPPTADERTEVLVPAAEAGAAPRVLDTTRDLRPADGRAPGVDLRPSDGRAPGVDLPPADGRAPGDEPGSADAEYSATVLASHWIERPERDETLVDHAARKRPVPPDRVEGTVLRFGPGVTATVGHRTHRTLAATPAPPPRPRRPRRHALPVFVVLCVLALLAWQRLGPPLRVGAATVTARPAELDCDGTASIVALVTTNGRPGTLSYRWVRSDGTASGVLEEKTVRGQKRARLHLRWTFQGPGRHTARAELRILSPIERTATTRFTYACP